MVLYLLEQRPPCRFCGEVIRNTVVRLILILAVQACWTCQLVVPLWGEH